MLNNGENKAMENGYVVLPIEKYTELINQLKEANEQAEKFIRLTTNYRDQITVDIDSQRVYDAAKKLYESSSFNTPERELIEPEHFRVYSADLTKELPTEDEE